MMEPTKKRGRPRQFDPSAALKSAGRTFLQHGYTGTSLDALTTSMNLNKPSLYAAFGDKHALYMSTLKERYRMVAARYQLAFDKGKNLEDGLRRVFEEAVEICLGEGGPPGCPIAAAATTESLLDEDIGAFTRHVRALSDDGIARWFRAKGSGKGDTSAEGLARLAQGVLYDIALRARVGESRAKLREIARDAARVLAQAAR